MNFQRNNVLSLALIILIAIFLLPFVTYGIYPDEVANQIWVTRFLEDAPFRSSVLPQCSNTFISKIPIFLYPAAFILSPISWISDIYIFRAFTSLLLLILLILVFKIFVKESRDGKLVFIIYLFGILSGSKLFSLVIFRPETTVCLLIIYGYFIILFNKGYLFKTSYVLLYSIAVYMHPFSIFFLPAALLVLRRNYFYLAFVLGSTYFGIQLWNHQMFECDYREMVNLLKNFNISIFDLFNDPRDTLLRIYENIGLERLQDIYEKLLINSDYKNSAYYLPGFTSIFILSISNILSLMFFAISILYGIIFIIISLIKIRNTNPKKLYAFLIFIGVFCHIILNKTNAFYAVSFWYFVLTFFACLGFIWLLRFRIKGNGILKYTAWFSIVFGISVSLILINKTWDHIGPNINLAHSHYDSHYRTLVVKKFEECCKNLPSNSFAIDDASYFILKKYIQYPVPVTYAKIFGISAQIYRDKNIKYLITRCGNLRGSKFIVEGGYGDSNICFIPADQVID